MPIRMKFDKFRFIEWQGVTPLCRLRYEVIIIYSKTVFAKFAYIFVPFELGRPRYLYGVLRPESA